MTSPKQFLLTLAFMLVVGFAVVKLTGYSDAAETLVIIGQGKSLVPESNGSYNTKTEEFHFQKGALVKIEGSVIVPLADAEEVAKALVALAIITRKYAGVLEDFVAYRGVKIESANAAILNGEVETMKANAKAAEALLTKWRERVADMKREVKAEGTKP